MYKFNNIIHIMSAPRSGSTFLTQIFKHIFTKVTNTHDYLSHSEIIIFRNFLDSAISLYRVHNDLEDDFFVTDESVLDEIINNYLKYAKYIEHYCFHNMNGKLFLIYEYDIMLNGCNNYDKIFKKIENHFNIIIPQKNKEIIIKDTNIHINKERSNKLDTFHKWDSNLIHGKHVNGGETNLHKKHIIETLHEKCLNCELMEIYYNCVKKIGYKND